MRCHKLQETHVGRQKSPEALAVLAVAGDLQVSADHDSDDGVEHQQHGVRPKADEEGADPKHVENHRGPCAYLDADLLSIVKRR